MSPQMSRLYTLYLIHFTSLIHFQQTLSPHLVNQFYREGGGGGLTRRATPAHALLRYERIRQILPRTRSSTANFSLWASAAPPLPPSAGRVVRVLTRATHTAHTSFSQIFEPQLQAKEKMYNPGPVDNTRPESGMEWARPVCTSHPNRFPPLFFFIFMRRGEYPIGVETIELGKCNDELGKGHVPRLIFLDRECRIVLDR